MVVNVIVVAVTPVIVVRFFRSTATDPLATSSLPDLLALHGAGLIATSITAPTLGPASGSGAG
jgi:hypothetical protein